MEILPNTVAFEIPREAFTIVDDNIDEDEQSFAIVAEIGPDVPENVSCFQLGVGSTRCHGRRGATEIRIIDNDRKLFCLEGKHGIVEGFRFMLFINPWCACAARVTVIGLCIFVRLSVCLSVHLSLC